ncbi:MAG: hypothetical protein ACKO3K_11540 [Cuspidothrix sp.]
MKIKFTLAVRTMLVCALGFLNIRAIATPEKTPKTFTQWCQQKSTLPPQTKRTVDVLLEIADTQDCNQANQTLTQLQQLNLREKQIRDIS